MSNIANRGGGLRELSSEMGTMGAMLERHSFEIRSGFGATRGSRRSVSRATTWVWRWERNVLYQAQLQIQGKFL